MARVQRAEHLPFAPIDLRVYGVEVGPQLPYFETVHIVVGMVTLVQSAFITLLLMWAHKPGYVRRQVVAYCLSTVIFSAVYAFTGHTFFSNFLAVAHNHWEVQLIAIALFKESAWPKFRRVSLAYYAVFAVASLFMTVKNGRRVWTMFGLIWDGMLPIVYGLRFVRAGRQGPWKYGLIASIFHLWSILQLLALVDGVSQYFSLLVPPTCLGWAFFVLKYERRSILQTLGAHWDPKAKAAEHLPDHAFFLLFLGTLLVLGVPAAAAIYGERVTDSVLVEYQAA